MDYGDCLSSISEVGTARLLQQSDSRLGQTYCTSWQACRNEEDRVWSATATSWSELLHIHLLCEYASAGCSIIRLVVASNVEDVSMIRALCRIALWLYGVRADTVE